MADRPRTAGELDAWCDKLAIHETVYRYTDALNRADWPALAGLFAPAAVWEMTEPTVRHYEGATAIAEGLGGLLDQGGDALPDRAQPGGHPPRW